MSMSLAGPGLTTTSYKKRKEKMTKEKMARLEQEWRDRNQRLKQQGLPKETFEQYLDFAYGRGEKKKVNNGRSSTIKQGSLPSVPPTRRMVSTNKQPAMVDPTSCSKAAPKVYTGTAMIGIATMHKSNMVPVFSDEEAKDISKMRR